MKVGRPSFAKVFSSVNSFHALVDYSQAHVLGEVYEADEDHDGKLILRIRRQLPKREGKVSLCFVRPQSTEMSLGQSLLHALDYGFKPAVHHETAASLRMAVPEQIGQLFRQADQAMMDHGFDRQAAVVTIADLGSAVAGKTGELIPVHEVVRSCGRSCRLHLRKLDLDAPVPPAMMIPLVSA